MGRTWANLIFMSTIACLILIISGCGSKSQNQAEMVKRGEYLVNLGSCNFCHTPKTWLKSGMEIDTTRLLSGHPEGTFDSVYTSESMNDSGIIFDANFNLTQWSGPWGVSFAANLTPDEETGIGMWDENSFIQTMRTGKHMGTGRKIQLPMPWDNLSKLTDDDLKAIFAYLKSIKPIKNRVPEPIIRQ